jgi:hypothetical protein
MSDELGRRDLLKIAAITVSAGALGIAQQPARFFSAPEFALVDELAEMLIPADDHSPGARAAQAAAYIDATLAESQDSERTTLWRNGVAMVDRMATDANGKPFLQLTPEQRVALLERMAKNETDPEAHEEHFFHELKRAVVHAYYTSKIGIHQEMGYKGNVYLNEFAGTEVS